MPPKEGTNLILGSTYTATLVGPSGYRVTLDRREVFEDDPGQGTPALVRHHLGGVATYWCALGEGEIELGTTGEYLSIPHSVMAWLESIDPQVTEFLYKDAC